MTETESIWKYDGLYDGGDGDGDGQDVDHCVGVRPGTVRLSVDVRLCYSSSGYRVGEDEDVHPERDDGDGDDIDGERTY